MFYFHFNSPSTIYEQNVIWMSYFTSNLVGYRFKLQTRVEFPVCDGFQDVITVGNCG